LIYIKELRLEAVFDTLSLEKATEGTQSLILLANALHPFFQAQQQRPFTEPDKGSVGPLLFYLARAATLIAGSRCEVSALAGERSEPVGLRSHEH
jgi:hypothetical protein